MPMRYNRLSCFFTSFIVFLFSDIISHLIPDMVESMDCLQTLYFISYHQLAGIEISCHNELQMSSRMFRLPRSSEVDCVLPSRKISPFYYPLLLSFVFFVMVLNGPHVVY